MLFIFRHRHTIVSSFLAHFRLYMAGPWRILLNGIVSRSRVAWRHALSARWERRSILMQAQFRMASGASAVVTSTSSDKHCRSCGSCVNMAQIICGTCDQIQPMERETDFFELFDMPRSFELNGEELHEMYRQRQKMVHPDRFAQSKQADQDLSAMASSKLNQAYETLSNPLSRAHYMLVQYMGVDPLAEGASSGAGSGDMELLMEMMERRSVVEDPSTPLDEIHAQMRQADTDMTRAIDGLRESFRALEPAIGAPPSEHSSSGVSEPTGAVQEACMLLIRLQYLTKLKQKGREVLDSRRHEGRQ